ncbi:16S rRNA (guanine(527)-N(7))-methyltransferase RsmG [Arcanobacterium hippocoleae]|uniref:Ribosomal RNA small subunit methyltransferase G n=1 Tax=Arcanobacterium hippocoleae TaxID=149017 RepID=A0ABU1T2G3_9ACTO|nr:16S rRNA (guanine(527)-N(7))-methyltransferase RsmG [Arcanobacterium hippocoleae]MDR6939580.1 16S rRNA (guanine527-N7)-methyltransferase [Arcanobacterium hippocoleae]
MNNFSTQSPPAGGIERFGEEAWQKLLGFAQLLESEGQLRGLVGPREMDKLWSRHILNSTALLEFLPHGSELSDVGSGAGFPGMVIAAIRPDINVYLIETMERRADWLKYVKDELKILNVQVIRARAEELVGKHSTKFVTARAVAALKKLIPWTLPLVSENGSLLALKGIRAEAEIDEAKKQLKKYSAAWADIYDVDVWGTDEGTRVLEVKKK